MTIYELTEEDVEDFERMMKPLTQAEYDRYEYTPYYSHEKEALEDDGRGDVHGNFY